MDFTPQPNSPVAVSAVGTQTPTDGLALPTDCVDVKAFVEFFDGAANGQRLRGGTLGDLAGVLFGTQPSSTPGAAAPAVNTAAVVTFGAVVGQAHRLTMLSWSTNLVPTTAGTVTVSDGTTTYTWDVPTTAAAGEHNIPLPPGGIKFAVGAALTITLSALGATILGRVNAAKITG